MLAYVAVVVPYRIGFTKARPAATTYQDYHMMFILIELRPHFVPGLPHVGTLAGHRGLHADVHVRGLRGHLLHRRHGTQLPNRVPSPAVSMPLRCELAQMHCKSSGAVIQMTLAT